MAFALILSAMAMTLIVAVRYLLTSGLFAAWTARRFPGRLAGQGRQIRSEIGWSLASASIYGIPAGIVAWGWQERGWTRIYSDDAAYPWWWIPASLLLYLLVHDSYFYWTHRLMHRPWWYKRMHAVHHASRPPTAWAAMSFHPWEAISGALVIPALVFLVPIHVAVLAAVLAIMTLMGVTNHMGWEMFPARIVHGKLGKWLITASHHELHHQKYRCNYGLYFRHWDRLCGTDRGLGEFGAPVARRDTDRRGNAGDGREPSGARG
jgi:sterol desaturase/sphingolipid hydroxylase (fatty acid hydroxylase superfamily)